MPEIMDEVSARDVVDIDVSRLDAFLEKEWLLTNCRGSYASGTVLGCHTRRYHGLLIASMHPPVERMVTISNLIETVDFDGRRHELSTFEFSDRLHPQGYRFLRQFRRNEGVHFHYEIGDLKIEKSVYLLADDDVALVSYAFSDIGQEVKVSLMPMAAMRDFHGLQNSSGSLMVTPQDGIISVHGIDPHSPAVHMTCQGATFQRGPDWWYAVRYRQEARRGQHDYEDVWIPGAFNATFTGPRRLTLVVRATAGLDRPGPMTMDVDDVASQLGQRQRELLYLADARDDDDIALVRAADQFVVRRQIGENRESTSILAGYHWFADWGRDTLIALPGLLLCTGRFPEARDVLLTFAGALDQGMIPNRFDDYGGAPHYNSVDASLWFAQAAYQYLLTSEDQRSFQENFRPVIAQILSAYEQGTRFNIHADTDGLIAAGDAQTQLTWMDAKCNGVAFTPRYGKAVEINALWINALNIMAETAPDPAQQECYAQKARHAEESFLRLFWNDRDLYLYDCISPEGTPDASLRPNQIFAVSLPFGCLDHRQQVAVVEMVRSHLLTPYGLRSLSPQDPRFRGRYEGDMFQRDSAYHQGTVWAWLIGPFVEAYLKAYRYSEQALHEARQMLGPLLRHVHENGCLGSVSEIFDGAPPFDSKGCIAQAWSVGELLRVKRLLK